MAVNSKDIETLWKQYSEEGAKQGISVAQFFESNGVPYHTFEKWYKKKFSKNGIVDCVVAGLPDATIQVPEGEKAESNRLEKRGDVSPCVMAQNAVPYKSRVTYITRSFPTRMEQ